MKFSKSKVGKTDKDYSHEWPPRSSFSRLGKAYGMKYEIMSTEGYPIKFPNGKLVYTGNRSGSVLDEFMNMLIVPIKGADDDADGNFVGYNEEGEIVWRFNEGNYLGVKDRFINAWIDDTKNLWIKNRAGKEYKVDYKTGKVLDTKFGNIDFGYKVYKWYTRLKIKNKTHDIPGEVRRIRTYKGLFLIVEVYNMHTSKNMTYIYYSNGKIFECLSGDVNFSETEDGKYIVVIYEIIEQHMCANYGLLKIYKNGKTPKLIFGENKMVVFESYSYSYIPKTECLSFCQAHYWHQFDWGTHDMILIKPKQKQFTYLTGKGAKLVSGGKNPNQIILSDSDTRISSKYIKKPEIVDLEKLEWFDLNELGDEHQIYRDVFSPVKYQELNYELYSIFDIMLCLEGAGHNFDYHHHPPQIKLRGRDIKIILPTKDALDGANFAGIAVYVDKNDPLNSDFTLYEKLAKKFGLKKGRKLNRDKIKDFAKTHEFVVNKIPGYREWIQRNSCCLFPPIVVKWIGIVLVVIMLRKAIPLLLL